jgi:hypothetical protein
VTAEDDLLVGRLAANLLRAKQVDLSLCAPTGEELKEPLRYSVFRNVTTF